MSQHYTEQTKRILHDLLDTLEKESAVDRAFLQDVKQLAARGALASRGQVRAAIECLENRLADQTQRPGS